MRTIKVAALMFSFVFILCGAQSLQAQGHLNLSGLHGTSKIKLSYGSRSVTIDLDTELGGDNGSLPGDPPQHYRVMFTAEKDGFLYLVAEVRSSSPISSKNAPCGGDMPLGLLWIKTDKMLQNHQVNSQIYESCSYNFYDSKVTISKTWVSIYYGARDKMRLTYDNTKPDLGLQVQKL